MSPAKKNKILKTGVVDTKIDAVVEAPPIAQGHVAIISAKDHKMVMSPKAQGLWKNKRVLG